MAEYGVLREDGMEPRAPIFGLSSIGVAILMAALWLILERYPHVGDGLNGYLGIVIALFLYLGTFILAGAGIVLGIAGVVRRERAKWLALAGIIANCVLLLRVHG